MSDPFAYEKSFWGNCANTIEEERKQYAYAAEMGLPIHPRGYIEHFSGKRVLDIGGGPVSLLLKTPGVIGTVVDPLPYPTWVYMRYDAAGIASRVAPGETIADPMDSFDEVWIYNVLQHVDDPEAILRHALRVAPVIRLFEWINLPAYPGHPQALTEARLNAGLNAIGRTGRMENTDFYAIWLKTR